MLCKNIFRQTIFSYILFVFQYFLIPGFAKAINMETQKQPQKRIILLYRFKEMFYDFVVLVTK